MDAHTPPPAGLLARARPFRLKMIGNFRVCILTLALLAKPAVAGAEQSPQPDNNADIEFTIDTIIRNYAGYDTKVTDGNRPALDALTAKLRAEGPVAADAELLALLRTWTDFFHDGHTGIYAINSAAQAPVLEIDHIDLSEAEILNRLKARGTQRNLIEGVWTGAGGAFRVGVLRISAAPDRFAAITLASSVPNWASGDVKAIFKALPDGGYETVYSGTTKRLNALIVGLEAHNNILNMRNIAGNWRREWPKVNAPERIDREFPATELFLRRLSPHTLWLRVPSFDLAYAQDIRTLIEAHAGELAQTENLIIDIRRNPGGSDSAFQPLLPYIYSRPFLTVGLELRASEGNIRLFREQAQKLREKNPDIADAYEKRAARMDAHLGQYISAGSQPFDIARVDNASAMPKHVAILIDGAGSTAEQLLLIARQSRRVTLFGKRNSAGVLDFANVVSMTSPSGRFTLRWATTRSLRLPNDPVDPEGIEPDIKIPKAVEDPVTFAQ